MLFRSSRREEAHFLFEAQVGKWAGEKVRTPELAFPTCTLEWSLLTSAATKLYD